MRKVLVRAAFFSLLLVGTSVPVAAEPPPLTAYGNLPSVERMAISQSGKSIAVLTTIEGNRVLLTLNADMTLRTRMDADDTKVRDFDWIGDDSLLVMTRRTEDLPFGFTTDQAELTRAMILPLDHTKEYILVFGDQREIVDAVFGHYGIRKIDGEWHAYLSAIKLERGTDRQLHFEHGRPRLYDTSLSTGRGRSLAQPGDEGQVRHWLLDESGSVAATFTITRKNGNWQIRNSARKLIASGSDGEGDAGLIALGRNGDTLVYYEEDEERNRKWYEVPLAGGERKLVLDDIDVDGVYTDDLTGRMLGYVTNNKSVFFDPKHQAIIKKVESAFAGRHMEIMDWTPNLTHVLVRTRGNEDSGTWFLVDVANFSAEAIGFERPSIGIEDVGPISLVEFTAADGLEMDGVLTLPPGLEATNLPIIMFPHGGPHSQDEVDFDWWAQAFASRGYAVFQPNFRGSTGRSDEFRNASNGEWGRKMQSDISDGLAELARRGIVDPQRACIMGASYGGYAALAGVTLQQGIYRCAVAVAPVTDLRRMYRTDLRENGGSKMVRLNLDEELGPRDRFNEISPQRQAERADAPILLIHGKNDTVVDFEQSEQMADALKDAGKPYELVVLKEEDHHLSRSKTRMQMLQAAMDFIQKHNPAD